MTYFGVELTLHKFWGGWRDKVQVLGDLQLNFSFTKRGFRGKVTYHMFVISFEICIPVRLVN